MLYNSTLAIEISRLVQEERLAAAQQNMLLHELALANRLEMKASPFSNMRRMMNRVMSLIF